MESFQNPDITITEICKEHGIAVSLFYKWKEKCLDKWNNDNRFRAYYSMLFTNIMIVIERENTSIIEDL